MVEGEQEVKVETGSGAETGLDGEVEVEGNA
jgi:hypothetical protein